MTFEDWLEDGEGVLLFVLDLKQEWIAESRIVWNAAIEAAAKVVEDRGIKIGGCIQPKITAREIRELSSNETTNV